MRRAAATAKAMPSSAGARYASHVSMMLERNGSGSTLVTVAKATWMKRPKEMFGG